MNFSIWIHLVKSGTQGIAALTWLVRMGWEIDEEGEIGYRDDVLC